MLNETSFNKLKGLPENLKQFIGLIILTIVIISSFAILNNIFSEGDELVRKMKLEEERIAKERKLFRQN